MKIALIHPGKAWLEALLRKLPRPEDDWVTFEDERRLWESLAAEPWDAVVASGDFVASSERLNRLINMIRLVSISPSIRIAVVLEEAALMNPHVEELFDGNGANEVWRIAAASPERTTERILTFVYGEDGRRTLRERTPKLAAFIGTTPNVGTTVISFGSAVLLANGSGASIGYLCLNLKSSKLHRYLGKDESPLALDSLRAELRSRSLSGARLKQYAEPVKGVPNLHVLYGSVQREQAEFYQPEDIGHLLEAARQAFDACIVEVNAYWDNAATVCAMLEADERICVTTADLGHFQEDMERGLKTMASLYRIPAQSFLLVVNQLDRQQGQGGIRTADIRKETGMRVVGEIERSAELLEYLNQGRLHQFFAENVKFPGQLMGIVSRMSQQFELPRRNEGSRKAWLKRLLPSFGMHG